MVVSHAPRYHMKKEIITSGRPFFIINQFGQFVYDSANNCLIYNSGDLKGQWYADILWFSKTHFCLKFTAKKTIVNLLDCRK